MLQVCERISELQVEVKQQICEPAKLHNWVSLDGNVSFSFPLVLNLRTCCLLLASFLSNEMLALPLVELRTC